MTEEKKKTAKGKGAKNGASAESQTPGQVQQIDPEIMGKITQLRSTIRENFGKVVMAMMMVPRYRAQTLSDLNHLVLDPIMHDRIAIAYPGKATEAKAPENIETDMSGFAIWASVSEEVDAKIREQISNGVFPIRLKNADWNSGKINWLLDVVAQDPKTIASVIANFRKVAKDGDLRLHPLISRMVDAETLQKMGARKASDSSTGEATGKA